MINFPLRILAPQHGRGRTLSNQQAARARFCNFKSEQSARSALTDAYSRREPVGSVAVDWADRLKSYD